jgi:hypothetical protein
MARRSLSVDTSMFERACARLAAQVEDPEDLMPAGHLLEAKAVELANIDTGNLESSSIVEGRRTSSGPEVLVGFTASYAAEVHEMPFDRRGPRTREKPGNEFGPAGPGFLIRPMRGLAGRFLEVIGETLKKKLR